MRENYLTYPCKTMRITQSYDGAASHKPHTVGFPADYPIDEGCEDSGSSAMYCPCDEMQIMRIYGVGNSGTNTFWLQSTEKVLFADGTRDYFTIMVIHPNDSELKKLNQGQTFTRGEKICSEGKDGATGNHFHFSAGKGKYAGKGWIKNSKGKWVLTVTEGTYKPEKLFFIDPTFTVIKNSKGLCFRTLPEAAEYKKGNYRVTVDLLNVRTGPGTDYPKKTFSQLTEDARKKISALSGYKAKGYVKGLAFTAYEIKGCWGRTPSGWVCLDYCEAIK